MVFNHFSNLISIIVPIFNDKDVISRLVNDVLIYYKNLSNFEIIFVDDCSLDNSLAFLEQTLIMNDYNNFIILKSMKNEGAAAARNKGCKIARGEYIAFLDSDDAWHKDKLLIQINFMKQQNAYMSGTLHKILTEDQLKTECNKEIDLENIKYKEMKWPWILFRSPFSTPSVVIRKEVFEKYCFNEKLRYAEDYDLWVRISHEYKTIKIFENLTYTFKHDFISQNQSLSSNLFSMQKAVTKVRFLLLKKKNYSNKNKLFIFMAILFEFAKFQLRILKSLMRKRYN